MSFKILWAFSHLSSISLAVRKPMIFWAALITSQSVQSEWLLLLLCKHTQELGSGALRLKFLSEKFMFKKFRLEMCDENVKTNVVCDPRNSKLLTCCTLAPLIMCRSWLAFAHFLSVVIHQLFTDFKRLFAVHHSYGVVSIYIN